MTQQFIKKPPNLYPQYHETYCVFHLELLLKKGEPMRLFGLKGQ